MLYKYITIHDYIHAFKYQIITFHIKLIIPLEVLEFTKYNEVDINKFII